MERKVKFSLTLDEALILMQDLDKGDTDRMRSMADNIRVQLGAIACEHCGDLIIPKRRNKRFCSDKCRTKNYRHTHPPEAVVEPPDEPTGSISNAVEIDETKILPKPKNAKKKNGIKAEPVKDLKKKPCRHAWEPQEDDSLRCFLCGVLRKDAVLEAVDGI